MKIIISNAGARYLAVILILMYVNRRNRKNTVPFSINMSCMKAR